MLFSTSFLQCTIDRAEARAIHLPMSGSTIDETIQSFMINPHRNLSTAYFLAFKGHVCYLE